MKDCSVHSIVTDPPYGIEFMARKWDYDVPSQEIWEECLRVLKPGGYLLAFAGSRTYHRMAVRIEDAGFEIRDQIMWIYGSGFPKSLDVGKAIEGKLTHGSSNTQDFHKLKGEKIKSNLGYHKTNAELMYRGNDYNGRHEYVANPQFTTNEAKEWKGWGTALKPAHEPIVMARKPLVEKTIAENVLEWGTGGINIDDSRIEITHDDNINNKNPHTKGGFGYGDAYIYGKSKGVEHYDFSKGRYPANVIHGGLQEDWSRYFYTSKASKTDRNEGVEKNAHPTVKPTDLMLYLTRLITPKNGIVLDPFMGSGSTGKACVRGGFAFIGIELEEEYYNIAKARIDYEMKNPYIEKYKQRKPQAQKTLDDFLA